MTNNENDPNEPVGDVDIDTQEDFDKEPQQKASFKDTWDNNPLLKIAAVVVVVGVLAGAYVMFLGGDEQSNASHVNGVGTNVKNTVGKGDLDVTYREALEKENEQRAKEAESKNGSSMPIPIGKPQDDALSIPPAAKPEAGDPLQEWRAKAEARRLSLESESAPPEEDVQAPDIVPMVQPIRPQPTMKLDPAAAKALTAQMQAIIATQAPKPASRLRVTRTDNMWALKKKADTAAAAKKKQQDALDAKGLASGGGASLGGGSGSSSNPGKGPAKTELIIPAGNIAYAQLLNDLNSDIIGPALAQVMSGPLEGGRAIGQFAKQDEYLTLTFKRVVKDGVSYSINGIALNEDTTLGALQSDVDHHYYQRIILPMAAQFLTGYTQAASQVASTTTVGSGGNTVTDTPKPDPKQELMQGATQAAQTLSTMMTQDQGRPITVFVNRGTTMGILFMDNVTTANATQ